MNRKFLAILIILLPLFSAALTYAQSQSTNLDVSVTVPVNATHYQLQLIGPSGNDFGQDSVLGYQIIYGSYLSFASNITIEVSWNGGSQAVVDYVFNSATAAHNGASPAVDLANQKIVWTINNMPGQTLDKSLYFALKTNNLYKGSSGIDFTTTAHLISGQITTPDIVITKTYKYNSGSSSSSTTTNYIPPSSQTTTSLSAVNSNQFQFKPPLQTVFNTVFLTSISESDAKILVELKDKFFPSISFGTKPNLLNNKISALSSGKLQEMTLDQLQPETQYYFKVEAKDDKGRVTGTETFVFKTAAVSDKPDIEQDSLIVSSSNSILSSPQTGNEQPQTAQEVKNKIKERNTVVVTKETPYEIRFRLKKYESIKQVKAILKLKNVLGISTVEAAQPSENTVDLEQIEPGVFIGRLKAPPDAGLYEIVARITDYHGNIVEKKVADVKVMKKMTVFDAKSKTPIEGARVFVYFYNPQSKQYQKISSLATSIKNPGFSDRKGELDFVLPNGTYKAGVENLGYNGKNVEFTIGPHDEDRFPAIYLEKAPFNPLTVAMYYWNTGVDLLDNTKLYVAGLSNSVRFFELNALVASVFLAFLTLLSFSSRIHIPIHSLFEYVIHRGKILAVQKKLGEKIKGRVFDEQTNEALINADVYLIDGAKNKIVAHSSTDKQGNFMFTKLATHNYDFDIMKDGYEPLVLHESDIQAVGLGGYLINIHKREQGPRFGEKVKVFGRKFLSLLFEALLILSFVFELSLGYTLGWTKAFPFLLFSIVNLILWLIHLSHLRSEKNIF